jgi:hypothetical protein
VNEFFFIPFIQVYYRYSPSLKMTVAHFRNTFLLICLFWKASYLSPWATNMHWKRMVRSLSVPPMSLLPQMAKTSLLWEKIFRKVCKN